MHPVSSKLSELCPFLEIRVRQNFEVRKSPAKGGVCERGRVDYLLQQVWLQLLPVAHLVTITPCTVRAHIVRLILTIIQVSKL